MKTYICGFLFSQNREEVALIIKNKPEWQKNKANGIGGKVEMIHHPETDKHYKYSALENVKDAMTREFKEETGVLIQPEEWNHYVTLKGIDYECNFFRAFKDPWECQTMEEEQIIVINVDALDVYDHIPNLRWLIPLALDKTIHHVTVIDTGN